LEYKDLLKSLKAKEYKPVYFLHGEEAFFMDKIAEVIENQVLTESEKSFNQTIFYGKDTESTAVVDAARRYPMMADRQVVILKEAQDMKTLVNLQKYVERPTSSTILLIVHKHKKLDMRSAFAKALTKNAVVMESKPLYDNQIPEWIRNYLKEINLMIEANAADLVAEYLGTDLGKIANELDKLRLNVPPNATVTMKNVQDNIGISKDYNVFELQKALSAKNILTANKIVQYFAQNPKDAPFVVVISNLYNYFSKVYMLHFLANKPDKEVLETMGLRGEFFLREYKTAARHYNTFKTEQILGFLREYDMKSKGVDADGVDHGELLKELIFKVLH
jgi:DNA polymerase III subunit delta